MGWACWSLGPFTVYVGTGGSRSGQADPWVSMWLAQVLTVAAVGQVLAVVASIRPGRQADPWAPEQHG